MKKRIIVAALGLTLLGLSLVSHSVLADSKKEIVVATDSDTAPFTYKKDETFKGYDIDVLKAVFEGVKDYKVTFKTVAFSSILTGLDSGRYQIAANDFNYNDERAEKYLFSDSVSKSNYAIVSAEGTSYTSLDDLSGKSTEVIAGSNYAQILEDWNSSHTDKNPIVINYVANSTGLSSRMQNIENKKIDFILYDAISSNYIIKDQGIKAVVNTVTDTVGSDKDGLEYFLFADDSDGKTLRKFVNKRLVALKKDGTLKKLSQKYFGGDFVSDLK